MSTKRAASTMVGGILKNAEREIALARRYLYSNGGDRKGVMVLWAPIRAAFDTADRHCRESSDAQLSGAWKMKLIDLASSKQNKKGSSSTNIDQMTKFNSIFDIFCRRRSKSDLVFDQFIKLVKLFFIFDPTL